MRPNRLLRIVSYDYLKPIEFTRTTKSSEIQDPKFLFCTRLTPCATNIDIFCLTELNKKDEGTQSKHQNARENNILRINVTQFPLTIQERKLKLKQHDHQFCIIPTKLCTRVFPISLFGSQFLYTLVRNQGLEYYRVFR